MKYFRLSLTVVAFLGIAPTSSFAAQTATGGPAFKKITLSSEFISEGAHFADFNHDGKMDVVAGPYWFEGPDFKARHEFTAPAAKPYTPATGYSDYFLTFTYDFNGDGWSDILVYTWPGKEAAWYENPQKRDGHWFRHVILAVADNESPDLLDVNGDGKPELLCHTGGQLGYAEADWKNPDRPWTFHPISPRDDKKYFRYTHGYGCGDLNGDGRPDLLERDGWWEHPADNKPDTLWKFHSFAFSPAGMRGGSQMLVYDVNGDGLNDVITSWDAHGYGLAWYEQAREGGEIKFREHMLMNTKPEDNAYGVKFTQLHSMFLVDINGDGLKDFVTGKRFWAHGPNTDAEPGAPAVLYWWELKRSPGGKADFIPHQIDDDSGVGTQVVAGDLNGDGKPDIVVSNKKGAFVFLQSGAKAK
jgi:hypothetical protein